MGLLCVLNVVSGLLGWMTVMFSANVCNAQNGAQSRSCNNLTLDGVKHCSTQLWCKGQPNLNVSLPWVRGSDNLWAWKQQICSLHDLELLQLDLSKNFPFWSSYKINKSFLAHTNGLVYLIKPHFFTAQNYIYFLFICLFNKKLIEIKNNIDKINSYRI